VQFSVTGASGFGSTRAALLEAATAHPKVLRGDGMSPDVTLDRVGGNLDVTLSVWVPDVGERGAVASDLRQAALERFPAHGVQLPGPTVVLQG
jgi:small-conductance mechanosensitive channel